VTKREMAERMANTLPDRERDTTRPDSPASGAPRNWDRRLALAFSFAASPPALVCLAAVMVAVAAPEPGAWKWASAYILIAVFAPLGYLFWEFHRGAVSDLDIPDRRQRLLPQVFTVACMLTAWVLLRLGPAPDRMANLGGFFLVQAIVIFGITLRWKISVHCATAAGVGMLIWLTSGASLPLLVGAPAMIWSRLRLDRHTLAQTMAGAAVGALTFHLTM
jgi:membrane-associated phospholipid phosphatase